MSGSWRIYINSLIAREISRASKYFDRVIQLWPKENESGLLIAAIKNEQKQTTSDLDKVKLGDETSLFLLNGNLNHDYDIHDTFEKLKSKLNRSSRVVVVAYNPYYRWLYRLANILGIRKGEMPCTFVTRKDLYVICKLAQYQVVRIRPLVYCPLRLLGLGSAINSVLPAVPIFRWLSLVTIITLRAIIKEEGLPSLSIVVPARNEKGNIEPLIKELPNFDNAKIEVIFVEGHSEDGTWEEISRVKEKYRQLSIKALQQEGRGKSDAVALGFAKASNELLTILDADRTVAPKQIEKFYQTYCRGIGDFINGTRLVYAMENNAMQFLNQFGNVFFAKALSHVLDTPLSDTLCGTKLFSRVDYQRFCAWREDFGDFDPFGDFNLLFPAAQLGIGNIDIPIHYRSRQYGSTNISRFSDGWMLLKMTAIGFWRLKLAR